METITIQKILQEFDVILLDAFGVLVDDEGALAHAPAFISHLNQIGKEYFILTNGSKFLPRISAEIYQRKGLNIAVDRVISSGTLLKKWVIQENLKGAASWILGGESTKDLARECGLNPVPYDQPAKCLVLANQDGFQFPDDLDTTISQIRKLIRIGQPPKLVCPNPDVIYPLRKGSFGITTGAIATLIEKALGAITDPPHLTFTYLGKPFLPIFEEVIGRFPNQKICMLGDQLATDIQGANAAGLTSILVGTGIDQTVNSNSLIKPNFYLRNLSLKD